MSENVTLVQLMESVGNVNHAVSILVYWMFESNYKKELLLTLYSLNIICSPLEREGMFASFETVFHSVRYINQRGKIKISDQ